MTPGKTEKLEKSLRELSGAQGELCQLAQRILQTCNPQSKGHMLASFKQWWQQPVSAQPSAKEQYFRDFVSRNLKASDLEEMDFIFLIGAQIAANACGDYVPKSIGAVGNALTGKLTAYYDIDQDRLVMTVTGIASYVHTKYADQHTDPEFREKFLVEKNTLVRDIIKRGAEEYSHIAQMKNPQKRKQIEDELTIKYGRSWRAVRGALFEQALRAGPDAVKKFYDEDPFEKDSHAFVSSLQDKIDLAAQRFQEGLRRSPG